jgi:cytoskeletal protein CcmA (bactofilin family)
MAYDDIRISELPSLPDLHNNDLFLIQDVTNNLAHRIDWGRLKNSIGRLSKGIIFPLGTEEEPEIAIGDYTSGIMAEDYGTFAIVTHGEKRFKVNQAGSMELINGNVLIGGFDRQCFYTLIVNNLSTFNCYTKFGSDVDIDGNLDVGGDLSGGKDLNIPGDVILGTDCSNSLIINSQIRALCDMDLKGTMTIHTDLWVDKNARILGDVALGTNCENKFDVYSNAWFRCDLRVDGDLRFGGDLILDGDVTIGSGCDNDINLLGNTTVYCDLRVKGNTTLEKDLYVNQNVAIDGNLFAKEDTILGVGCQYTTTINSTLTVECTSFFRGEVIIGDDSLPCPGTRLLVNGTVETPCDILGHKDLVIDHDTTLGTDCNDDLLVKATPVFECDAEFQKAVNITDNLFVGGDFTTNGHLIEIADPNTGCTNPNLINIHGEVHIDCNLFVSGDVFYDGDLSITGPDITFGAGCGLSTIHLQGYTIAHCDMLVKGDTAPFALAVDKNMEVKGNTEMRGTLNVAKDSAHDANLFVHENALLNQPVPAYDYWEQCECVDLSFPGTQKRGPDQETFILGTQKSMCQVYLNDPRWYKANNADPHVQETEIYGSLFARANVDLNSNAAKSADGNHQQKTSVWGQLQQYSVVELNKYIDTGKGHGYNSSDHATNTINFNTLTNKDQTVVHGDANFRKSVILNDGESRLTIVKGKFEAREEARLEKNVHLSGGNSGNSRKCGTYSTNIWGDLVQHCSTTLGEGCGDQVTINGKVYMMAGVSLSSSWGSSNVTGGERGFWQSGGGDCTAGSWMHAVTSAVSGSSQSGTTSDIQITVSNGSNNAGATTISGKAGNGKFDVKVSGGLLTGSGSMTANQNGDSSVTIGLTESAICGLMKPLTVGDGLSGSYSPCSGGTIKANPPDCSALGLGTLTINGDAWNPCDGNKEITIEGGDGTTDPPTTGPTPGAGKLVLKAGDGITIDKGTNNNFNANQQTGKDCTWTFNVDPASCPDYSEAISASRIRVKASGGAKNPGIALGTSQAYNGNGPYAGIYSNQANGSISVIRGTKWKNIDNCGGQSDGDPDKLFSVAAGLTVLPHHGTVGLIQNSGGKNVSVDCFKYADSELDSGINGGAPQPREYNRMCFNQTSFSRGEIPEVNRASDSRVDINIDSVLDRLGGFADDPETPNGMFRWGLKPLAEDDNTTYPFLYMDADEVGSIFPNLVDWTPKNTSWQRVNVYAEDGTVDYTEHELKDSFNPATDLAPGKINQNALIGLTLAGVNRQRKRLDNLKVVDDNGTTTLNNPVKFEEIVKIDLDKLPHAMNDTAAANMGVSVGQVYRNGSQLMIRVT